jgi:hypothetical protein
MKMEIKKLILISLAISTYNKTAASAASPG